MSIRSGILDNLETALRNVMDDTTYPLVIKAIERNKVNFTDALSNTLPMIVIYDPCETQVLVADATHDRMQMRVYLIGAIESQSDDAMNDDIEQMVSFLQQFANSSPSLGSAVLRTRFVQVQSGSYAPAATRNRATAVAEIEIEYVCAAGVY